MRHAKPADANGTAFMAARRVVGRATRLSVPTRNRGLRDGRFFPPFAVAAGGQLCAALHTSRINIMVTKRASWYKHFEFESC
jgi:hypothetical protein